METYFKILLTFNFLILPETIGEDVVIFVDCSTVQPFVNWTLADDFPGYIGNIELNYTCTNSSQDVVSPTSQCYYKFHNDS